MWIQKIAPFISTLILVAITSFLGAFCALFCRIYCGGEFPYPRQIPEADVSALAEYLEGKSDRAEADAAALESFIDKIVHENFASKKLEEGFIEQAPAVKIDGGFLELGFSVRVPFIGSRRMAFLFRFLDENWTLENMSIGGAKIPNAAARAVFNGIVQSYVGGDVFDACRERMEHTQISALGDKLIFAEK